MRIQGFTYAEAAELLGVAPRTVQRRLDRGLQLLTERLGDLGPGATPPVLNRSRRQHPSPVTTA